MNVLLVLGLLLPFGALFFVWRHRQSSGAYLALMICELLAVACFLQAPPSLVDGPKARDAAGYQSITAKVVSYLGVDDTVQLITDRGSKLSVSANSSSVPSLNTELSYYCNSQGECFLPEQRVGVSGWVGAAQVVVVFLIIVPLLWAIALIPNDQQDSRGTRRPVVHS